MLRANTLHYRLKFIIPGGTSRGVLKEKDTYFLKIEGQDRVGIGECALFRGLSWDDRPNYEIQLKEVVSKIESGVNPEKILLELDHWPSIQFGLETALKSYNSQNPHCIFDGGFFQQKNGIEINGLIWMGDWDFMHQQLKKKLKDGFTCIKIKIGAIDFDKELDLLRKIRQEYSKEEVEIRVDANGAFSPSDVREKLDALSQFQIHSIEQPIKKGQIESMKNLASNPILPIALDEELIGIISFDKKQELLSEIKPQYIVLKPALLGGYIHTDEWISLAEKLNINWWVTSSLESNIGLNGIAQYVDSKQNEMPQGLGTGQLFSNNFLSPLELRANELWYGDGKWDLSNLNP